MKNTTEYMSDIELLTGIYKEIKEIKNKLPDHHKQAANTAGLIDTAELIATLKITDRTARTWRKNGVLPYIKIGGRFYYRLSDITDKIE